MRTTLTKSKRTLQLLYSQTKISRVLSGTKNGLTVLALMIYSCTVYSQASYTYNYTGSIQTKTLLPGTYDIKMWGADGGSSNNSRQGRGGYSNGTLTIGATTTLYIGVGGSPAYTGSTGLQPGGYNGGGSGYANSTGRAGGGATHIATVTGVLSSLSSNTSAVIMVAGGGGGDQNAGSIGHGGGSSGGGTYPGTQTGSSGSSSALNGTFGQGGNITTSYGGGGGGGWYGGGGNQNNAGSGGSGFIGGAGISNGVTTMSTVTGFVTKPVTTADGLVIITELCSITLSATGANANNAICSGNSVTLTTNAISNYSWSTGASTSSIVVSPTATTPYTLTATSPSSCTASAVITIGVYSGTPTLTIVNTATNAGGVCPGASVALTANGAVTYTWTGGVVNGATFVPTSTQTYVVTGENACGTGTAATSVSIHPQPTITLSASQPTVCTTQSISLCPSGGVSYTMSPATPTCAAYYPFSSQTYTVRGSSVLGCTNSAMATVNVTVTPVIPPVSNPTLICIGGTATLSATGASNYSWTPFSPPVTTNSLVVNPTTSTTYTLTKWNANCVSTDSVRLIVNQLPTVFAVANPTIVCASTPATLTAGGGVSYQWAPGNLPSGPNAYTVVVTPSATTIYTVTASDGTCSNVGMVSLATNPNPTITIATNTTSICQGASFSYSISGADSYTYSNNPATSPPITNTTGVITLTTITNYQVTGVNQHGCTSSKSQLIMVFMPDNINVTRTSSLVCPGGPATLVASSVPQVTFAWSPQATTGSASVVNPQTTSIYTVTGTNTTNACQNTRTISISVFQPSFVCSNDTDICRGGAITLTASGANSFTWTGGPFTASNVSFYNVSPTVQTIYTVTGKSNTLTMSCYTFQTIQVGIYLQPTVTASPSRTQAICKNEFVYLRGHGATSYYWPVPNETADSVKVFPLTDTKYRVIGTDAFGCKDTFDLLVKYSGCPGFAEISKNQVGISVYPNPNNGVFTIESPVDMNVQLVNELGQVIREFVLSSSNSRSVDVKDLAPGVYYLQGNHDGKVVNQKLLISH